MRFRPCIDIHNGQVKQIVGSSLSDIGDFAKENFVSAQDAAFFARMYKEKGLYGGHIIVLNSADSPYYEASVEQALSALRETPGYLQVGGGITAKNAWKFLDAGASHVIVTSYVFKNGEVNYDNLKKLVSEVGKEHLVLDLSCRKWIDNKDAFCRSEAKRQAAEEVEPQYLIAGEIGAEKKTAEETEPKNLIAGEITADKKKAEEIEPKNLIAGEIGADKKYKGQNDFTADGKKCGHESGRYYIVTDRWQKMTSVELNEDTLDEFSSYCDEFLIHAVDVEGKQSGIEAELATMLGNWGKIPMTYAGGVHSLEDIEFLRSCAAGKLDVTVGSALEIFGGSIAIDELISAISLN
ncbi:HisA/HisF-related TIM barrel protein [Butyrivibrio sp. JL13D10]|uniref:HisA/HisF-related TIM barrel protein n=1 Tax=Butyrivibrio sp. JL13D10 TaxID=3236815 RepID=UPI0038B63E11